MLKRTDFLVKPFLFLLILLVLSAPVSADENKINITYVAWQPGDALELASQTNPYSGFIEYTYIPAFNDTYYASDELLAAVDSGFLETQERSLTG